MNSKPIIAWDNLVAGDDVVLTALTTESGYRVEYLDDWRGYYRWKGTGTSTGWVKVDAGNGNTIRPTCLGLAFHDLFTQGAANLTLEWSDNDSSWTEAVAAFTPASDEPLLKFFTTAAAHRYWRLNIPSGYTAAPYLGVLFLGTYLTLPRYFQDGFDPDSEKVEDQEFVSREGNLLGVVEYYRPFEMRCEMRRLTDSWCTGTWKPFLRAHGHNPFFFIYDKTNHPLDVRLARLEDPSISMPFEGNWRKVELTLVGAIE